MREGREVGGQGGSHRPAGPLWKPWPCRLQPDNHIRRILSIHTHKGEGHNEGRFETHSPFGVLIPGVFLQRCLGFAFLAAGLVCKHKGSVLAKLLSCWPTPLCIPSLACPPPALSGLSVGPSCLARLIGCWFSTCQASDRSLPLIPVAKTRHVSFRKVIYFLITKDDGVEQKEGRSELGQKGLLQTFLPPHQPREGCWALWKEELKLKGGGVFRASG